MWVQGHDRNLGGGRELEVSQPLFDKTFVTPKCDFSTLNDAMLKGKFLILISPASPAANFPHTRSESFYQNRRSQHQDRTRFCWRASEHEITTPNPVTAQIAVNYITNGGVILDPLSAI